MSSRLARAFKRHWMPIAVVTSLATLGAIIVVAPSFSQTNSENEAPPADPADSGPAKSAKPKANRARKTKPKAERKKVEEKKAEDKKMPQAPAGPATLAGAAATGAGAAAPAPLDIAAKLKLAGAGTCAAAMNADAAPSMIGVTQSNTITTWSNIEPRDKHAATIFIGQRYGASQAVPYGVTGLIASPNSSGACDSTVVQVVASPLPCASVRETLLHQGKSGGDLAGVALVQSGQDQTLLMPTATNTCVLVGFHSTFRK